MEPERFKLRLVIQARPPTRSGVRQKTEYKRIAVRSQNSFNIEAESAFRKKTRKPIRAPAFPQVWLGNVTESRLVRQRAVPQMIPI